jgi:alcohol dehydrogenase class IV
MLSFVYEGLPSRVIFGVGCLDRLPEEVDRLGVSRVLVLSPLEQSKWRAALQPGWATDVAVQNPYYNPRPVDRASIRELLEDALEGRRPS